MLDEDPGIAGAPAGDRPVDQTGRQTVLKHERCLVLSGPTGDLEGGPVVPGTAADPGGVWLDDTRMLSRLVLTLGGTQLVPLSTAIDRTGVIETVTATNAVFLGADGGAVPANSLSVRRRRVVTGDGPAEWIAITNHGPEAITLALGWSWQADFRDLFEVRGKARPARGTAGPLEIGGTTVEHRYRGLDAVERTTSLAFSPAPDRLVAGRAAQTLVIPAGGTGRVRLVIRVARRCRPTASRPPAVADAGPGPAMRRMIRTRRDRMRRFLRVGVDDPMVDGWLRQSACDLAMLVTELATGPYPTAGSPWFAVPFGRDGVITALFTLWTDPGLARGVLRHLAATLATDTDPARDAEPGKARHEQRRGEMAATGEIPFGAYYGGVDTTALFVWLAGEYVARTGDYTTAAGLWPDIERAMGWIDRRRAHDPDGFLSYRGSAVGGLKHQGWKDSFDAVSHADGRLAEGEIALVEVQGYVVAAKRAMADIAMVLHREARGVRLLQEAEGLSRAIERRFWDPALGTYALALDGDRRACAIAASNPGHLLAAKAINPMRADAVADRMARPDFETGTGPRSLSAQAARYSPLSYHNGSVWPQDAALLALGCARYGRTDRAAALFDGLFAAARHFPRYRLPELWAGHAVRSGMAPVAYPSACSPQAWSAAAVFGCLQACLGLVVDGAANTVTLNRPHLPQAIGRVSIRDLPTGHGSVSFTVRRDGAATRACLDHAGNGARLILS